MKSIIFLILLLGFSLPWPIAFAAEGEKADNKPEIQSQDLYPKALDGVMIEAVENYPNPKNNEVGLSLGVFPFEPYYVGFSLNADYVYYFDKTLAWEILNVGAAFTVNSDLSSQLAEKFKVDPQKISKLNFICSSNLMYVFTHGKLLFTNKFIRYFRSSLIGGVGFVNSTLDTSAGVNVGIRFDAYVNDSFSWKIEFRDMITFTSGLHSLGAITLGTGINF